jgi:DNA-binding beta-propeller fold protein YncE
LLIYSYEVSSTEGFTFSPLYSGPLVIDPSDMLLIEETLIVLGYPRRFAEDSANRLGSIDVSDPTNPRVKKIESFSLDGWMTEYVVVVIDEGLLYVTDVFGHLFEIRLDDFSTVRSVRPGASTLQADVWGKVLFTAAPYAREILQIDRESLSIIGRLPAGNAMREVVADPARGRVFSTSYGEGTLYGWKLPEPDGDVERAGTVSLGSPLRGLDLLSTSGDILVGSGCGVFRINPEEALGL